MCQDVSWIMLGVGAGRFIIVLWTILRKTGSVIEPVGTEPDNAMRISGMGARKGDRFLKSFP